MGADTLYSSEICVASVSLAKYKEHSLALEENIYQDVFTVSCRPKSYRFVYEICMKQGSDVPHHHKSIFNV